MRPVDDNHLAQNETDLDVLGVVIPYKAAVDTGSLKVQLDTMTLAVFEGNSC